MQDAHEKQEPDEVYYTIREAANHLRVAESTVWRWVDRGLMPAYRLPGRRLRLKKEDVEMAVKPTQEQRPQAPDWRQWVTERHGGRIPLDELMARVEEHKQKMVARRRGKPLPSSVDDIRAARGEWGRRLDDI